MTAPLSRVIEADAPAVTTAGNSDDTIIGQVPFDATITAVEYVPEAAITGAATNHRTFSLVNKGQAGSSTTALATLAFDSGAVTATANNERAITLTATTADRNVTQGDTLLWRSVAVGTGIADPGGMVRVTLARRDA